MQEQLALVAFYGTPASLPIASESKSTNKRVGIDWECFFDRKIPGILLLKQTFHWKSKLCFQKTTEFLKEWKIGGNNLLKSNKLPREEKKINILLLKRKITNLESPKESHSYIKACIHSGVK